MDGAQSLVRNGLMQSDLDANNFKILNLDTSNLPISATPPSVIAPTSNWLNSWDASSRTWGFSRPNFTDIAGSLTAGQQSAITQVGNLLSGQWLATPIAPAYLPTLDAIRNPVANVSMAGKRLTNLDFPVDDGDAVNKQFMDALLLGLNPKQAVRCATTALITLAGLQTIDGITVTVGDRVLVKDQIPDTGVSVANGIYVVATGAWTRSTDADTGPELNRAYCNVLQGTLNAGTGWVQIKTVTIVGTDPIQFVIFSPASNMTAGNGLQRVGNTFSVVGTANRITVGAAVDIATTYVGQTSITTLGTIGTGTWQGTVIDPQYGGTGFNNNGFGIQLGAPLTLTVMGFPLSPSLELKIIGTSSVRVPNAGTLATLDGVGILTNKAIVKRVVKTATSASPSINVDLVDAYYLTALSTNITSMTTNLSGTPTDSQELIVWFHDDGTARSIAWGAAFSSTGDVALPATTVVGSWLFTRFVYLSEISKWTAVAAINHIS